MSSSKELPPSTTPFFPNQFITNQFYSKAQYVSSDTDLSGKVAIVTGANTGLGLECARQLLSYKLSQLIVAVRSLRKGEDAAADLRKQHPDADIEVWLLDMSSYDSIQAFASQVKAKLPRLDIAILNAGLSNSTFRLASTGHEETMQVNYLSTMLLSILLLPLLKIKSPAGTPGRLTIVTSMLSLTAKFAQKSEIPLLKAFDDEKTFDGVDIYPTSKYLGQLFLWKLTDLVSANDVVINYVEPGFVKGTSLQREAPAPIKFLLYLLKVTTGRSMKLGATTYLDAAITKGKESHGCLLMNWGIAP
jgi:NAD(P)-dependent dehydrogenase (short-subunit alcohol dehydrogenase family)